MTRLYHFYHYLRFAFSRKSQERFMRGLRLEMLVQKARGQVDVVDDYLYQALRSPRFPTVIDLFYKGSDRPSFRYLRLPISRYSPEGEDKSNA